ncbi:hypothetical protein [Paractinoplanes lichenicola]|uniref:Uncharacterized protein n=1 Tax=Paractinoplanes lichenicola TaxID=2802976 RepID=A0ABS1VYP7_9ACTN|nr:hypothetical protein [Actinoplanes lichenicola]MBL7259585.1 hypothetical protein [Actinoplanes lichenicola]
MNNLDHAVRTAAARVPSAPPNLGAVLHRARRVKRCRTVGAAAAAVVTVAALAATVPQYLPRRNVIVGDPLGGPSIGLWLDREILPKTQGLPSGKHVPGSSGEVGAQLRTVDGKPAIVVAADPQPGLSGLTRFGPAPLPGGGLATIGVSADQKSFRVVVTDAAGRVASNKPLPDLKTDVSRGMQMTGNGTSLFWWEVRAEKGNKSRPVLITYNIAQGTLSERTPSAALTGGELPYFGMQATESRIVEWPAEFGRTCSFELLDAATGERVAKFRPDIAGCSDVYYALSPDNRHVAALVTTRSGGERTQRVVVLNARTGKTVTTFDTPGPVTESLYGLAWAGHDAIRYARGDEGGAAPLVLTMKL